MQQTPFQLVGQATDVSVLARHRVLRNTYFLLALSMVPTVFGAMLGVRLGGFLVSGSMLLNTLLFLGIAFAFIWGIERSKNSGLGVALLLGFTFFMGLMLSRILLVALGFTNGGTLIATAAGATGAIFFVLAGVATVTKKDFSFLGQFLFVGLILLCLVSLANLYFQLPTLSLVLSGVSALLFSAYILFDVSRIVNGGEDNYITAALAVYLDIINLFQSLLHLLMAFGGERD